MTSSEQRHATTTYVKACYDAGVQTHAAEALNIMPNLSSVHSFAAGEEQEEVS